MEKEEHLNLGILIGMLIIGIPVCIFLSNGSSDIGLSQEAGDLICKELTNNPNAYAVDWRSKYDEPMDSLICKIDERKTEIGDGLIQIYDREGGKK